MRFFFAFVIAVLVAPLESWGADACPVAPIALQPGATTTIVDTTRGRHDDFSDFCGDGPPFSAPDVVYAFSLPADGTFRIKARSAPPADDAAGILDPAIYLRDECAVPDYCFDFFPTVESYAVHLSAGTYYVVVDGSQGSSGRFALSASFTWPVCGDGVLNPGEACDTGPGASGDGCGDPGGPGGCQLEPDPIGDGCPGVGLMLAAGTTIVHGSTIGAADDVRSPRLAEAGGRDRIYALTPAASGSLTATLGLGPDGITDVCALDPSLAGCWDRALYARSSCSSATFAAELAFSDEGALDVEQISFAVTAGVPVFLVVDGYDDQFYSAGTFDLKVVLQ